MTTVRRTLRTVRPDGDLAIGPSGPMSLPAHGPSQQVVRTPSWLSDSVGMTFGEVAPDVASDDENAVFYCHCTEADDGLSLPWNPAPGYIAWCHPPFNNIGPWVEHTANQRFETSSVLLVLASVGSDWWASYVDRKAEVVFIPGVAQKIRRGR